MTAGAAGCWDILRRSLPDGGGEEITLRRDGVSCTVADIIAAWRKDGASFAAMLAASPLEAFFWEMPPLRNQDMGTPFACVLIEAPSLAGLRADDAAFARHFAAATGDVVAFDNISGDARLVAPVPGRGEAAHLASYLRSAGRAPLDALFAALAANLEQRLGSAPLWVSTAGLGVSWLHIRIDKRPKYYRWRPYRAAPAG